MSVAQGVAVATAAAAAAASVYYYRMSQRQWKNVSYGAYGAVTRCLFCDIVAKRELGDGSRTRVFAETDRLVAFHPRGTAAMGHILVVPREHLRNAVHLGPEHRQLVAEMAEWGSELLVAHAQRAREAVPADGGVVVDLTDPADPLVSPLQAPRFVFHMAPFNSVDHLHLHCLLPPFKSTIQEHIYRPGRMWCSSAAQVIASL